MGNQKSIADALKVTSKQIIGSVAGRPIGTVGEDRAQRVQGRLNFPIFGRKAEMGDGQQKDTLRKKVEISEKRTAHNGGTNNQAAAGAPGKRTEGNPGTKDTAGAPIDDVPGEGLWKCRGHQFQGIASILRCINCGASRNFCKKHAFTICAYTESVENGKKRVHWQS